MATNVLHQPAIQGRVDRVEAEQTGQYSLWQILGIWALVTLPMVLLSWVVAPAIIPHSPLHPGITYWLLMIAGMAWEFVVSLVIVYRELGTLRWSAIRKRTWLQTPRDPGTGRPNPRLYWWALLPLLVNVVVILFLENYLNAPMRWLFPALQAPQYTDVAQLAGPEFRGQWWIMGVALASVTFNYFLGEEFLFRGVLLPKMEGVFGRHAWVANGLLFALYHAHKIWTLPGQIVTCLMVAWPAGRFRSSWMAIIVHGVEGLPVLLMPLAFLLGLL